MKCEWCTDKELRNNKATLDIEVVEELLHELGTHRTGVTLEGGGEPTLYPKFREVISTGARLGVGMGLISNGTVDISDCANKLKWIRISLDSSTKEEYIKEKGVDCFEHVLENLQMMSAARDPQKTFVGVGYVLTTRNQCNLLGLVKQLDAIGVDYIYLRPVEEAGDITPSLENLLDLRRQLANFTAKTRIRYMLTITDRVIEQNAGLPCIAHSLTSIIHANGEIALCEKRRQDGIILGNLYEDTFENIWLSSYRKQVSQRLRNPECQKGCRACRMTGFNMLFNQLENVHTRHFI